MVAVEVDLAQADGPGGLVAEAVERHGRVDVLVNNVGAVRIRVDGFLGTSDDEFDWALQLNFFTALRATRAVIPPMLEQGGGAIVNVALVNAFFQPDAATIDYGAAKAAVLNLSKSLSQEFGPRGSTSTASRRARSRPTSGSVTRASRPPSATRPGSRRPPCASRPAGIATRRFSTPQEVATLVALLASPRTANVTGANYVIDGGLVKTM